MFLNFATINQKLELLHNLNYDSTLRIKINIIVMPLNNSYFHYINFGDRLLTHHYRHDYLNI